MMNPPIEGLLDAADSKFGLVTLAAKRARQINSYFNHLGDASGQVVPPQVTSVSRKPLSISFEEIADGKIALRRLDPAAAAEADTTVEGGAPVTSAALVGADGPAAG